MQPGARGFRATVALVTAGLLCPWVTPGGAVAAVDEEARRLYSKAEVSTARRDWQRFDELRAQLGQATH